MNLLNYVDTATLQQTTVLTEEDKQAISGEVIARINAEFDDATLRSPTDEDRRVVRERIGTLVAAAVRRRGSLTHGKG